MSGRAQMHTRIEAEAVTASTESTRATATLIFLKIVQKTRCDAREAGMWVI